ncbi:MAG: fasciclin domain-containing protein [Ginsengibacter sp.]
MQINQIKKYTSSKLALLCATVFLAVSCNKDLPEAIPIEFPDANPIAKTLGEEISSNPDYSIFKAAATKVGAMALLNDNTKRFTLFVPNNAAFIASGITADAIAALPAATVGAIVQYHIIPGKQFLAADIPSTFPNVQLPSYMKIGELPGTIVPIQMSIFPSKRGNTIWANTMPLTATDLKFKNGVIHLVAAVVAPPSAVLKDVIAAKPDLSYFRAAVVRADSGANLATTESLNFLLAYPVTNMTILAPNDNAFKTLIHGSIFGYLVGQGVDPATANDQATALSSTPDVFKNPALYGVLTAATVKGILAYHFLATNAGAGFQPNIRVFSNNFATTPTAYKTLVNAVVSVHPGVMAQATFTGPFVSSLTFTGMGTFPPNGPPFSDAPATAVSRDNHGVNGVFHIIDKVLLPQ